jgi:hypothetical protein
MAKPQVDPSRDPRRLVTGAGSRQSTSIVFGLDAARPIMTVMALGDDKYQLLGRIAERVMTKDQLRAALLRIAQSLTETAEAL